MKQLYLILLALLLTSFVDLNEGKRTSSGRRTSSGSSGYSNTRRVATSAPKHTSKPISSGTSYGGSSHAKPSSYNTHGQAPPPYSATNHQQSHANPSNTNHQSQLSRTATQRPISNNQRPITQKPLQSYPKQQYPVNSGYGAAKAVPNNQLPAGATMLNSPPGGYRSPGYHPPQTVINNFHPPPNAVPQYFPAGGSVQPGYYPPGQFPKQSGPGFGTGVGLGIVGGAIGGALLNNALSSNHRPNYGSGYNNDHGPTIIREKETIINNTNTITNYGPPPASGDPSVQQGGNYGPPMNSPDGQQGVPLAPLQGQQGVPLAPLQGQQPGIIHSPNQPNQQGPVEQPQMATFCYYDKIPSNDTAQNETEVLKCYSVPENSTQPDPAANNNDQYNAGHSQPTTNTESYSVSSKTSSVTMSETARIKQSGAIGKEISIFAPILTILLALFLQ